MTDLAAFPNYPVFAPDGTMYVTDLEQALIWRVPPGGGEAEVWFTDARLESVFGPNGIQFVDDGTTLLFAQTGSHPPGTTAAATGKLYRLPVKRDGSPGELDVLWEGGPVDGPDGFAIGRSGRVYVALAGANQLLVLGPDGEEEARVPATPAENLAQEVPFDTPASVAFIDRRVLITNQSFFTGTEQHWAVFDVFVDDLGLPLFRPQVPRSPTTTDERVREAPGADARGDVGEQPSLPATGAGGVVGAAAALAIGLSLAGWRTMRRRGT